MLENVSKALTPKAAASLAGVKLHPDVSHARPPDTAIG